MIAIAGRPAKTYVDPFDRICHGLGAFPPRNYRPERSTVQCTRSAKTPKPLRKMRNHSAGSQEGRKGVG